MCVILEADFIVGLTVKDKSVLNKLLRLNGELKFSVRDCIEKQRLCRTSGWGNVIAESTENDFKNYIGRNSEYFRLQPDGNYRVICENLTDRASGELDYERLLTLGVYNGAVFDAFDYPRTPQPIL